VVDDGLVAFSAAGVAGVAGQLAEVIGVLTSSVEQLREKVAAACGSWEGEARDVFVALMEDWNRQEADLRAVQQGLHDSVVAAHATFVAAHGAVQRRWNGA
jgi:WXG100 family type VII secretion target